VVDRAQILKDGESTYGQVCATCHLAGEGTDLVPPLKGSAVVAGDLGAFLGVLVKGQTNVSTINGKKVNGIMPAQDYMSDDDLAAVATYVRDRFASNPGVVTPDDVKKLR
jgi:nitrite reductase (NO-forming)